VTRSTGRRQTAVRATITLGGRQVDLRVVARHSARRLRVRVGFGGVEVVHPAQRAPIQVEAFLRANESWILGQLDRIERLRAVRRPLLLNAGVILYRGEPVSVRVEDIARRGRQNRVTITPDGIVIARGRTTQTPPARSLENWLRRRAREEITRHLADLTPRLKQAPRSVFVREQRTRWGSCTTRQNLSFNWRLIMAPDAVLRYLVTHEAVHLAIPDHSRRFWLTVQSLCPETERARQWLSANAHNLWIELEEVCPE
jgi:predicted metal-dependent hydrolase